MTRPLSITATSRLDALFAGLPLEYRGVLSFVPRVVIEDTSGNAEASTSMETLAVYINRAKLEADTFDAARMGAVVQHELAHAKEWLIAYKEMREVAEGQREQENTFMYRKNALSAATPAVLTLRYGARVWYVWADCVPEALYVASGKDTMTESEFTLFRDTVTEDARGIRDGFIRPYAALTQTLSLFGGKVRFPDFRLEEVTTLVDTYYEKEAWFKDTLLTALDADGKYRYPAFRAKVRLLREYGFLPYEPDAL